MSQELLSICIPTYNRARLLRQIFGGAGRANPRGGGRGKMSSFYISDNGSPDNTRQVVEEFEKTVRRALGLFISRNETNPRHQQKIF